MRKYLVMRKGADVYITISVLFLSFVGMLMTTSTSVGSEVNVANLISFFFKQIGFVFAGLFVMNFASNAFKFYRVERNYFKISVLMIVLLLLPLLFSPVNGARAWIRLPLGMSIQPSEFFKIFLIVLIGVCVEKSRSKNIPFQQAFFPVFVFGFIGVTVILLLQKDFGTALITTGISFILLMIPYHMNFTKIQYRMFIGSLIGIVIVMLLLTNPGLDLIINAFKGPKANYQVHRFIAARNPFLVAEDSGFQLIYGLEAIARGGIFGRGFGNSLVKFLIPEGRTDYIMAMVIEELGLIGFLLVSISMLTIIYRLVYFALRAKNESYKIILIGVALYFALHYILNVGGISGLIPLTGVPLLLVSAGGTSLIAVFLGIGISQGIIASIKKDMNKKE